MGFQKDCYLDRKKLMKRSKLQQVKAWLLSGHSITPRQAVAKYDAWRLSDICFKLRRHHGMRIISVLIRNKNGTTYSRYSMEKS